MATTPPPRAVRRRLHRERERVVEMGEREAGGSTVDAGQARKREEITSEILQDLEQFAAC
jgi:hypothetical protein